MDGLDRLEACLRDGGLLGGLSGGRRTRLADSSSSIRDRREGMENCRTQSEDAAATRRGTADAWPAQEHPLTPRSKTSVHHYDGSNVDLGTAAGRLYRVGVMSIQDAGDSDLVSGPAARASSREASSKRAVADGSAPSRGGLDVRRSWTCMHCTLYGQPACIDFVPCSSYHVTGPLPCLEVLVNPARLMIHSAWVILFQARNDATRS